MSDIDAASFQSAFDALAAIGRTDSGGIDRRAWSQADISARRWLMQQGRTAGLSARQDAAGNVILRAGPAEGPVIVIGSHIDSVANGGAFDGALGVIAGLEVLTAFRGDLAGGPALELVAFADEEGTYVDCFGSRAYTGALSTPSALGRTPGPDGRSLAAAMADAGLDLARAVEARRARADVLAYLELHIEQGNVLEAAGRPLGVVTAIVGTARLRVSFHGRADHAGTTPMHLRRDAMVGAARLVAGLRALPDHCGTPQARLTCGRLALQPGSDNVVPARVELGLDIRDAESEGLDRLLASVEQLARRIAEEEQLKLAFSVADRIEPVALDGSLVDMVASEALKLGIPTVELVSGAGHDAQVMGTWCPSVMIFVQSRDGRSHSPEEFSRPEHCREGLRLLAAVISRLHCEYRSRS
jgi:hydantoinase/carbamoylase family amidase